MNPLKTLPLRFVRTLATALCLAAGSASAATVGMPTSSGNQDFDRSGFAFATLAGPGGEFACFTAVTLSNCTPAMLTVAALGPDLSTGLALGVGGTVTLGFAPIGSSIALWEAGAMTLRDDVDSTLVSVHTAAGWTAFRSLGEGTMAPVLNDPRPSGFQTNFGVISASDFGLAPGTRIDGLRIDACCGNRSDFDLLAVAGFVPVTAVPEPSTSALVLAGLVAIGFLRRRRQRA